MSSMMDELFHGKEITDKVAAFRRELQEIDKQYEAFFKERENKITGKKPDTLENHYLLEYNRDGLRFNLLDEADLPLSLIAACNDAFKKVFNL
jgi:hypothetical protein